MGCHASVARAPPDALDPEFHGVRTPWIRGFHGVPAGPAQTNRDADGVDVS